MYFGCWMEENLIIVSAGYYNSVQMNTNYQSYRSHSEKKQIPCLYHNEHVIRNFCMNMECLLPLCQICVGLHVTDHRMRGTFPSFLSVWQAVGSASKELHSLCLSLQQDSKRYVSDYLRKQEMQEKCQTTIRQLKERLLRQIQLQFSAIEIKVYQQIQQFDSMIHQQYRQLETELRELYQKVQSQLKDFESEDTVLGALIKYHSEQHRQRIEYSVSKLQQKIAELNRQGINVEVKPIAFEIMSRIGPSVIVQSFKQCEFQTLVGTSRSGPSSEVNFYYSSRVN